MTSRHEYIDKLKEKLDEWDADIDELEDRARTAKAELKLELEDQITSLKLKRDIAKLKLSEIKDASEEAWEDIKAGAEEAWADVKDAMEKAKSHF
jgi:predicted RNase H-like nuclease (RuvC/YqgF family)